MNVELIRDFVEQNLEYDDCGEVALTIIAENVINHFGIAKEDEERIFELVVDFTGCYEDEYEPDFEEM